VRYWILLLLAGCNCDEVAETYDLSRLRDECHGKLPELGDTACRLFVGEPSCEEEEIFTDMAVNLDYPCDGAAYQTLCDASGFIECSCTVSLDEEPLWDCSLMKCEFWSCEEDPETEPDAGSY
jgi:hypothetical protein